MHSKCIFYVALLFLMALKTKQYLYINLMLNK